MLLARYSRLLTPVCGWENFSAPLWLGEGGHVTGSSQQLGAEVMVSTSCGLISCLRKALRRFFCSLPMTSYVPEHDFSVGLDAGVRMMQMWSSQPTRHRLIAHLRTSFVILRPWDLGTVITAACSAACSGPSRLIKGHCVSSSLFSQCSK